MLVAAGAQGAGNNTLHKPPYDFLMGNHIDTHLESKL